jgi:hypothetical protein
MVNPNFGPMSAEYDSEEDEADYKSNDVSDHTVAFSEMGKSAYSSDVSDQDDAESEAN